MGAHKHVQKQHTSNNLSSDVVRKRHVQQGGLGAAGGAPGKHAERTFSDDGMEKVISELPDWKVSASASSSQNAQPGVGHAHPRPACRAARCRRPSSRCVATSSVSSLHYVVMLQHQQRHAQQRHAPPPQAPVA